MLQIHVRLLRGTVTRFRGDVLIGRGEAGPRAFEELFLSTRARRRVRQAPTGRRSPEWKRRRALRRVRAFSATHRARMDRSDRHARRSARVLADYARQLEGETPVTATLCANETALRFERRRDRLFHMLARDTWLLCASNGWWRGNGLERPNAGAKRPRTAPSIHVRCTSSYVGGTSAHWRRRGVAKRSRVFM